MNQIKRILVSFCDTSDGSKMPLRTVDIEVPLHLTLTLEECEKAFVEMLVKLTEEKETQSVN